MDVVGKVLSGEICKIVANAKRLATALYVVDLSKKMWLYATGRACGLVKVLL